MYVYKLTQTHSLTGCYLAKASFPHFGRLISHRNTAYVFFDEFARRSHASTSAEGEKIDFVTISVELVCVTVWKQPLTCADLP